MTGPVAAGLRIWVRSDQRRRWRSLLALGLLAGIAFGVASVALAGARRTATSFYRMRAAARAYDVGVVIDAPDTFPDNPARNQYDDATVARIVHLPGVGAHGTLVTYIAALRGVDDWEFALNAPEDDVLGNEVERDRVLRGRMPDPNRTDEVAVNEAGVDQAHVDVGDVLHLVTLTPDQRSRLATDPNVLDKGPLGPTLDLKVTGVVRGPSDVVGRPNPDLIATPAFDRAYRGRVAYASRVIAIRLAPGTTAPQLDGAVGRAVGANQLGVMQAAVENKPARNTTHTLGLGLYLFALVAALASLLTVGLASSRHASGAEPDQAALVALGFTRAQRMRGIVAATAPAAVVGAVVAVVLGFAASAFMPVGLARRIEPDPGVRFDGLVAALTILAVVGVVSIAAAIGALPATRTRPATRRARRGSGVATSLASGGASPTVTTGVRLAFDRRPPALPVRSAVVGAGAAVVVLVAALMFSASLDRLAHDPQRWGYGWDLMVDTGHENQTRDAQSLAARPDLAGVSLLSTNFTYANGDGTRGYGLEPVRGHIGYALRSGVEPVGPDEAVIGPETARTMHLRVGDTLPVAVCPCGEDAPSKSAPVRVVGIALFPEDDAGNYNNALGFSAAGFARHVGDADAPRFAVQVAPGHSLTEVGQVLARRYPRQVSQYSYPARPGDVENLTTLRRFPLALAAFAAFLGLAALINALLTTVRRRRRELATLRSMGLTPRQTSACVGWQGVSLSVVALLIGVPLGALLGARAWTTVARSVDVATDTLQPVLALVILVVAVLTIAAGTGLAIGWRAAVARPARALRDE